MDCDSGTKDAKDIPLDPEVEAFAKWFADWWLRRGISLLKAVERADPDRSRQREQSKRTENDLPLRWDEKTGRIVLGKEREADE